MPGGKKLKRPPLLVLIVAPNGERHAVTLDSSRANVLTLDDYAVLCGQGGHKVLRTPPLSFCEFERGWGHLSFGDGACLAEAAVWFAQRKGCPPESLLVMTLLVYGSLGIVLDEGGMTTLTESALSASPGFADVIDQHEQVLATLDLDVWNLRRPAQLSHPLFADAPAFPDDADLPARYHYISSLLAAAGPPYLWVPGHVAPEAGLLPAPAGAALDEPPGQLPHAEQTE